MNTHLAIATTRIAFSRRLATTSLDPRFSKLASTGTSLFAQRLLGDSAICISRRALAVPQASTLSLAMVPETPRVQSYRFAQVKSACPEPVCLPHQLPLPLGNVRGERTARPSIRVQPPRDIVKLCDRLYYVLQPTLEMLIRRGSLHFPLEPFAY